MLKKILILIAASAVFTMLWFNGLERLWAHVLTFSSNTFISIGSDETQIALENRDEEMIFRVTTLIDGKRGSYPQRAQSLLLPTVIVLSWLPLLFFSLPGKTAARQSFTNMAIFLLFQVFFMILLTFYYNSAFAKYLFHLMMEAFYIIALGIIIKDAFKYPHIWKASLSKQPQNQQPSKPWKSTS